MIRLVRSVRVAAGKGPEAAQWALEITEYVNKTWQLEGPGQAFREVFGAAGTLYWIGDYADLATIERVQAESRTDEGYQALARRAADLVVAGSLRDTVLRSL